MLRFLIVLNVILVVYAVIDCARSEERERVGLPKLLWMLLIVLLPLLGPIAWLVISRGHRDDHPPAPTRPARPRPRPQGPLPPDDDPEFLWRLEQQARRERARRQDPEPEPPSDGSPDGRDARSERRDHNRTRDDED